ncbi:hypothetical protein ASPZODRAFT_138881 [Penicilliopsis zonata CBS 506.65]|uniref:Mid2 domain-containing protein n=1 Tax=Penicilliopsis zonata CBS 506.65 TaxID=1073090 RepID=A0A1L9SXB4_9EURO|nr:hypothetical protein ASPZODRAFT_138881 [Penicilliopsis zonata CBS 506.65]OJJ51824.1 hypothetical protein ASPZODRAFT_138881 [Penicilliopsis zonata CBS 506.65]
MEYHKLFSEKLIKNLRKNLYDNSQEIDAGFNIRIYPNELLSSKLTYYLNYPKVISLSLYRLVVNETANCTLELYSWAIPADFNTTDPQYQIGLFNASVLRGADGIALFGWQAWSPYFYVRDATTTAATATATATATTASTALLTGTGETATSTSPSTSAPTFTSASLSTSAMSNTTKIGIGVGVGVGAAAIVIGLVWFLLRRRRTALKDGLVPPTEPSEPPPPPSELPAYMPPMKGGGEIYEVQ